MSRYRVVIEDDGPDYCIRVAGHQDEYCPLHRNCRDGAIMAATNLAEAIMLDHSFSIVGILHISECGRVTDG